MPDPNADGRRHTDGAAGAVRPAQANFRASMLQCAHMECAPNENEGAQRTRGPRGRRRQSAGHEAMPAGIAKDWSVSAEMYEGMLNQAAPLCSQQVAAARRPASFSPWSWR